MGFEFDAVDSGFQVLGSRFILILDAGFHENSEILALYSGFQSPGFLITQENISRIPESGSPYMGRLKYFRNVDCIMTNHKTSKPQNRKVINIAAGV